MDAFEDVTAQAPPLPFYFRQFLSGPHENFHYVVGDPATGRAALIDPAFHVARIVAMAKTDGFDVREAWFTHGHWDHIGGVPEVFDLGIESMSIHAAAGDHPKVQQAGARARLLAEGDQSLGELPVQWLHTPGHQPESSCILVGAPDGPRALFGGDTLFIDSCGRIDFPGGDEDAMFASMARLRALDGDLHVMPGHHYASAPHATLAQQRRTNPAFTTDRAAFGALPFLRG